MHLLDYHAGKRHVWSVVRVPRLDQEERRQLHRELQTLKAERTEHVNRIKGILATLGLSLDKIDDEFETWVREQRLLETGQPVPKEYQERLLRECRRWKVVQEQIVELEAEQKWRVRTPSQTDGEKEKALNKVRKLLKLKGIGIKSAWLLGFEFFGWRTFQNRRQVGSLAGLTPTPYQSGNMDRELGMSKAGNSWVRGMIVEIAWVWLQWQPNSALSQWFKKKYVQAGRTIRKKGIVALARKLLIALWRWVEFDIKPEGAIEVSWESKVKGLPA
jgi:transposase